MSVYVIGRLRAEDFSWVAEYSPIAEKTVQRHGGKYLVRGANMEKIEGSEDLPTLMVVLEFPDAESVHAWHEDPEYKPMIELRQASSELELTIVEGL